jgi:hypothetical protein
MATLDTLTQSIVDRLTAAKNPGGALAAAKDAVILREDAKDLQTEINKAIGSIGCLILVGMPHFINRASIQNPRLEMMISTDIAIGEHPILWRKDNRPHAPTLAQIVAQLLHGYKIDGFNWLNVLRADFVPDPKRQLYELPIETLLIAPTIP